MELFSNRKISDLQTEISIFTPHSLSVPVCLWDLGLTPPTCILRSPISDLSRLTISLSPPPTSQKTRLGAHPSDFHSPISDLRFRKLALGGHRSDFHSPISDFRSRSNRQAHSLLMYYLVILTTTHSLEHVLGPTLPTSNLRSPISDQRRDGTSVVRRTSGALHSFLCDHSARLSYERTTSSLCRSEMAHLQTSNR